MKLLWWYWVAFGMLLMGVELLLPSFTILWFGLGAVTVGAILWLIPDMSFGMQLFLWAIFCVVYTVLWFRVINVRIKHKSLSGMAREQAVGKTGMVVRAPVDGGRGQVRFSVPLLGSDEWEFISEEQDIAVGDRVRVTGTSGNTLLVKPDR